MQVIADGAPRGLAGSASQEADTSLSMSISNQNAASGSSIPTSLSMSVSTGHLSDARITTGDSTANTHTTTTSSNTPTHSKMTHGPSHGETPASLTKSQSKVIKRAQIPNASVNRYIGQLPYWSQTPVFGQLPSRGFRSHTATLIGSDLWVFGGCDNRTCWRDMWKLDLETFEWFRIRPFVLDPTSPKKNARPPPIRAHSATAVGHYIVIFAGGDGGVYFNAVFVFDTTTYEWSKPALSGDIPPPRRAHSANYYKRSIYVFGGGNGDRALNDLYRLDVSDPLLQHLTWHHIVPTGEKPKMSGYHSFDCIGNRAVLFGGSDGSSCYNDVYILDLDKLVWTKPSIPNLLPQHARLSHSSVIVGQYPDMVQIFFLFGHNGNEYVDDILALNLTTLIFETQPTAGIPPPGRGYASATCFDGRVICIGGYDGKKVYQDVWTLDLSAMSYMCQPLQSAHDGPIP